MKKNIWVIALAMLANGLANAAVQDNSSESQAVYGDTQAIPIFLPSFEDVAFGVDELPLILPGNGSLTSTTRVANLEGSWFNNDTLLQASLSSGQSFSMHRDSSLERSRSLLATSMVNPGSLPREALSDSSHDSETGTWAMLLVGLGLVGLQLRRSSSERMVIN